MFSPYNKSPEMSINVNGIKAAIPQRYDIPPLEIVGIRRKTKKKLIFRTAFPKT
jgi:hypothetical protein